MGLYYGIVGQMARIELLQQALLMPDKAPLEGQKRSPEQIVMPILARRGITTPEQLEAFFHPQYSDATSKAAGIDATNLHSATARIIQAIASDQIINIVGDYDDDGTSATALLIRQLKRLGAKNVHGLIPNRKRDGYGISAPIVERLAGYSPPGSVVVTVDNGASAKKAFTIAQAHGFDSLLTDHHVIPKDAVDIDQTVHAMLHTTQLCGAGIAYKLAQDVTETMTGRKITYEEDDMLEIVANATIADIVPLTGVNRILTYHGLLKLQRTNYTPIKQLIAQLGLHQGHITERDVAMRIAPCLNAEGRMDDGGKTVEFLLSSQEETAHASAAHLIETNRARQELTQRATEHAMRILMERGEVSRNKLLMTGGKPAIFDQGVIGIVAARVRQEFNRPAIVMEIGERYAKGSVRSIKGFNIIEFLWQFPDFFVSLGGHPMAAGFTIKTEDIKPFYHTLTQAANNAIPSELLTSQEGIEGRLHFSEITPDLYQLIQQMAPFGKDNEEPLFVTEKARLLRRQRVKSKNIDSTHLKILVQQDGMIFTGFLPGRGGLYELLQTGELVDVAYRVRFNTYTNSAELLVERIEKSSRHAFSPLLHSSANS